MLPIFKKLYIKFFGDDAPIPPGETEFDYIPLKPKKTIKTKQTIVKVEKYQPKIVKLEEEIY